MPDLSRYQRQSLLAAIGNDGQQRLHSAHALVIGCGALGGLSAMFLARAGVGHLTLVDRDLVELHNLQRQVLFDERDALDALPKAVVAQRNLRAANSEIRIDALVMDVRADNIEALVQRADVVLDGTDNFHTRYVINDACVKHKVPWIYGGVVGTGGMTMTITPGQGPCLRCIFPEPPAPGATPTCDTVGVLGPAVGVIASIQSAEAIKLLTGTPRSEPRLLQVDLWDDCSTRVRLGASDPLCPTCARHEYAFLSELQGIATTSLCGRDAVQVSPMGGARVDLSELARRWQPCGEVATNPYMVRLRIQGFEISVFEDGRAIIKGTSDESVARTVHARFLGV